MLEGSCWEANSLDKAGYLCKLGAFLRTRHSYEAYISAKQYKTETDSRILSKNAHEIGTEGDKQEEVQRQKAIGCIGYSTQVMGAYGFPKSQRITKRSDYQRALRGGKRIHTRHFVLVFCPTAFTETRLGLIVSKRVGNAVKRNRVKRLIREFFRLNKSLFPVSFDMVVIAKPGAHTLTYHQVANEFSERAPFNV